MVHTFGVKLLNLNQASYVFTITTLFFFSFHTYPKRFWPGKNKKMHKILFLFDKRVCIAEGRNELFFYKFFVTIDTFSSKLSFSVLSMLETTAFFLKYFSFEGKKGKSGVRRKVYQASINKALFCLCLFKISVCPNVLEYLPLLHAEGIIFVMGR